MTRYTPLLLIVLLSSCLNQRKVTSWLDEHPEQAAEYCADKFPVKTDSVRTIVLDSSVRDTLIEIQKEPYYLPGDTVVTKDTVYVIKKQRVDKWIEVAKPCSTVTVTITKENTARVQQYQLMSQRLTGERDSYHAKRDWWRKIALILMVLIVVYVGLRIVKKSYLPWLPLPLLCVLFMLLVIFLFQEDLIQFGGGIVVSF